MSTESSRQIFLQWLSHFNAGRFDEIIEMSTPDATWWVVGTEGTNPVSGLHKLADTMKISESFFKSTKSFVLTAGDIVAEGDKVVGEISGKAELSDGRLYENNALIKIDIMDGRIAAAREYVDISKIEKLFAGAPS